MNTKYNYEDLLHSLPDYISNKLSNQDLKNAIETKINSDPDFKAEFLNLSETMDLFEPDFSESPSDAYFNNLSVRINEKINSETKHVSIFEKFGISLKFAFPVIAALLIITTAVIYFSNNANDNISNKENTITSEKTFEENNIVKSEENKTSDNNTELSGINNDQTNKDGQKIIQNDTPEKIAKTNIQINNRSVVEQSENPDNDATEDKSVFSKDIEPGTESLKAFANESLALADNSDIIEDNSDITEDSDNSDNNLTEQDVDVLISGDSDEDFLEEDIFDMTPEERNEIVEFLKQS